MFSVSTVDCAMAGNRGDEEPFRIPNTPCRAARMDEMGSIVVVDRRRWCMDWRVEEEVQTLNTNESSD